MAKKKYLVTGRAFGKNGELLKGQVIESDKEINHKSYQEVSASEAKKASEGKLEVATPKKDSD